MPRDGLTLTKHGYSRVLKRMNKNKTFTDSDVYWYIYDKYHNTPHD